MPIHFASRFFAVAWLALGPVAALAQTAPASDPYLAGLYLYEEGRVDAALDVWYEAWDSLSMEGLHDPRIGMAYARAAVEGEERGDYAVASEIYAWGFSGTDLEPYLDEVRQEVARITPLMQEADSAAMTRLADAGDPEVLRRIRMYWLSRDPTPETRLNERLMEHWERVAYAQSQFTRGRYTPYASDDRGAIYVKYGAPDKKTSGTMGARDDELRYWVQDPVEREALRRYDYGPQFEVWAYEDLNPREIVYFLFGNVDGRGQFQLLESPDDLIPPEAWSAASRGRGTGASSRGVKAGYYLQLFYYSELAIIGGPFSKRLGELENVWGVWESRGWNRGTNTMPPEGDLDVLAQRYVQEDRYANPHVPTVPEHSDLDDGSRSVAVVVEAVRTLSPDNEPQIYVVSVAGPKVRLEAEGRRRIRRRDVEQAEADGVRYSAEHTLVVRDERFQEVGRLRETVTPEQADMAVFLLRHVPQRLQYTVIVDVARAEAESEGQRLPGRAHFEVGEPLSTDPSHLVMSDVVTGVAPTADDDYSQIPFPIIPSRTIWRQDPIRLYLELYHLTQDPEGVARYRYDFRIAPDPDRGGARSEPVTLSLDLEYFGPTARDVFDIDITALPIGPATVTVQATDLRDGRTMSRTVPVEIAR